MAKAHSKLKFLMEINLAKPEWGLKRTCLNCGVRFYDMQRDPIICPSCETVFDPLALVRPKRARAAANQAKGKAQSKTMPNEESENENELLIDDEEGAIDISDDIDLDNNDADELLAENEDGSEIESSTVVSEALEHASGSDRDHDT